MSTPAPGAVLQPGLLRARHGVVSAFDVALGVGEVTSAEGTAFSFHCSAIEGGRRTIDVGAVVVFGVEAHHGGIVQAVDLLIVG